MRRPFLLALREGVSEAQIEEVAGRLPDGASATPDFEVGALVVRWADRCDASVINATHGMLAGCGYFLAGPGSEEAVLRYLPDDERPASCAMYENPESAWRILCERCGWGACHDQREAAHTDCLRHDEAVHGDR